MPSPGPVTGIVSTADLTRPDATYLPLESLDSHVYIVDASARVVLCQLYRNATEDVLREAHYVFPVPARAAVCSFRMEMEGRGLKGVVKEIAQAKAEYEQGIREGKLAALLQQFRRDVFVVCIGTIPPRKDVLITLSYVEDLSDDAKLDSIRFHLPSHVGVRYGAPPTSALFNGTAHRARASISVEVEMASNISNIESLTHSIERNVEQDRQASPDGRYAHVRWSSMDTFLNKDFLLVVQASGLDMPRCLAETIPSSRTSGNVNPTTALILTVVPRFNAPILPTQEYIFLIDCSGSMTGDKIQTAKSALTCFLSLLPYRSGTTFNIFRFGSSWSSLWVQSQHYENATLRSANSFIDTIDANMGGTELMGALQQVFNSRSRTIPTSIFVLTDGRVYAPQKIISYVRQEVSASVSAPVRLFTLGVGHGASTELCEGIAKAGNGFCSMTLQTEDLFQKSIQLVDAMRVAKVEDLTVEWGTSLDEALQAPDPIQSISPGVRLVVTAILSRNPPNEVVLRGRLSDGSALEYLVPVTRLSSPVSSLHYEDVWRGREIPPLLHTLAANKYIQGLDSGALQPRSHNLDALSPRAARRLIDNLIVKLGTRYQVASSLTAFVAVDAPSRQLTQAIPNSPQIRSRNEMRSPPRQGNDMNNAGPLRVAGTGNEDMVTQSRSPTSQMRPIPQNTSGSPSRHRGGDTEPRLDICVQEHSATTVVGEVMIIPDPEQRNRQIICIAPTLPATSIVTRPPGFWSFVYRNPLGAAQSIVPSVWDAFRGTDTTSKGKLIELSRLQAADGSFSLTRELFSAIGIPPESLRSSLPPSLASNSSGEQVWATAIAVAFLRSKMSSCRELWESLEQKACEIGSQLLGGSAPVFEEAVTEALRILQV